MDELLVLLRVKNKWQALAILSDLQRRHFIEFNILDDGNCVKYRIKDWHKLNRALDEAAPCHEDKGYFYLPTYVVSNMIGRRHLSEMDALLDLWLNAVYDDKRILFRDKRSDGEKKVMRIAHQATFSTAEIIKCVEADKTHFANDEEILDTIYHDEHTTSENIAYSVKSSPACRPVLNDVTRTRKYQYNSHLYCYDRRRAQAQDGAYEAYHIKKKSRCEHTETKDNITRVMSLVE